MMMCSAILRSLWPSLDSNDVIIVVCTYYGLLHTLKRIILLQKEILNNYGRLHTIVDKEFPAGQNLTDRCLSLDASSQVNV